MTNENMYETTIPFTGFYESIHSSIIDDAIEYHFSDREGYGLHKTPWELDFNYRKAMEEYSKKYCNILSEELDIDLTYKDLESPKEYNFTTDRIFVLIKESDLIRIRESLSDEALEEYVKDKFTDRSGFISFYQNSLKDTGNEYRRSWDRPVTEWDHNQIGTLIECYMESEHGDILGDLYVESFYFDDLPPIASQYADYLYEKQEEGEDFDSLMEYDEWIKTQETSEVANG